MHVSAPVSHHQVEQVTFRHDDHFCVGCSLHVLLKLYIKFIKIILFLLLRVIGVEYGTKSSAGTFFSVRAELTFSIQCRVLLAVMPVYIVV
jgi:hypothetical protein